MSIEAAIYDRLHSQSGIAGMVGTRIYPAGQPRQDAQLPLVTYQIDNKTRPGLLNGKCPAANYQIRVTGFALSHVEMKTLMGLVADALDVWKNGRVIFSSMQDEGTVSNEEAPELFSESHTFSVWYQTEV